MLKVYGINIFFPIYPPLPLKEYDLYTQFNIDNYGQTIIMFTGVGSVPLQRSTPARTISVWPSNSIPG